MIRTLSITMTSLTRSPRSPNGREQPLFSQDREKTLEMVLASPLTYQPGSKTVYSDVDYMLLCFIVEQVTGKRLDAFPEGDLLGPHGPDPCDLQPLAERLPERGLRRN